MGITEATLIGALWVTSYRSVQEQTDASPHFTSIGHHVSQEGVAVSPDLMASGTACYGDALIVEGEGVRVVNDVMHPRLQQSVDLWVDSYKEEKRIGKSKKKVWVLRSPTRYCNKKDRSK